jgi:catechol 2,3-dioxygenase-like lactoylglutathione lyase family enzyme
MLESKNARATVAVKDLEAARRFYEGPLGLNKADQPEAEVLVYEVGASRLLVYRSDFAGTNQATGVTWDVGNDVDRLVKTLRERGVRFEHYDMPEMVRVGDVHVAGDLRAAWFKDPDGNIHSLVNG